MAAPPTYKGRGRAAPPNTQVLHPKTLARRRHLLLPPPRAPLAADLGKPQTLVAIPSTSSLVCLNPRSSRSSLIVHHTRSGLRKSPARSPLYFRYHAVVLPESRGECYNLRCLLEQGRGRSSSSTERVTDCGSAAGTQRRKDRLRDLEIGKSTTTSPTRIRSR